MNDVFGRGSTLRLRPSVPLSVCAVCILSVGCSPSKSAASVHQSELWGDLRPTVSVKELMRDMLDPAADNIFGSVGVKVTKDGTIETLPTTEGDWEKIRVGGVTLAEGAYLLKVPRPFAPPGDLNNTVGPEVSELRPAQIRAKVERDLVEWNARIEALRNVGLEVIGIVKRKDVQELWDASENLDLACEACHKSYWYPGEDAQFYETLERRLRDSSAQPDSALTIKSKR